MTINLSGKGGGGVKSIQTGSLTLSSIGGNSLGTYDQTITEVDVDKSVAKVGFYSSHDLASQCTAELTSSTNLRIYARNHYSNSANFVIKWQVVEYM